jgi:imidazoleglycerol-phosphate dehydratase
MGGKSVSGLLSRWLNVTGSGIPMRKGAIARTTKETSIEASLDLDGSGVSDVSTGVGFFDHMLDQLARHSLIDMTVHAVGDRHVDDHHTVEDVGIALGHALAKALGDKKGLARYADCLLPMDETLTRVAVDVSGRPFLVFRTEFPTERIGTFDAELVREFFQAFAGNAGLTLHIETLYGVNSHHIAESCFKGVARALSEQRQVVCVGRSTRRPKRRLGREGAPLGQRGFKDIVRRYLLRRGRRRRQQD